MSSPGLVLFDDAQARTWAPFSLTRPIGELAFGTMTLRERAERVLGLSCEGHVTSERLRGFQEAGAPHVLPSDSEVIRDDRVFLSSRFVPDHDALGTMDQVVSDNGPAILSSRGEVVGFFVPAGARAPSSQTLLAPGADSGTGGKFELSGTTLTAPWTLVRDNPDQIRRDGARWSDVGALAGVNRIGEGILSLAEGAHIEPGVTVDLRDGPVRLEAGTRVEGPARLVGPLWIGADSIVFGGHVASSTIGPVSKIRGEVADCVLLGYTNKAHDGYLGHALLGRWVNLGAMTTNSDLKNNYGPVTVWTPRGPEQTGLMKVGCYLGDHVKTGIGTVLNTGTVVGAGSNIFGGAMPPTHVPAFSWGTGRDLTDHRLDKFLESAERAMARRDVALSSDMKGVYERAWNASAPERAAAP